MEQDGGRVLGATRLRVLDSLPPRHHDYFFEQIRASCMKYISREARHLSATDRLSEASELFSEVMAKLLGVAGVAAEKAPGADGAPDPGKLLTADDDPGRDGRVVWLISEVGGPQALKHRHEDMRRRQHGGKWRDEYGYRQVQLDDEHLDNLSVEPDDPLEDEDTRRTWQGLLAAAAAEFEPAEDVAVVLHLMAQDREIQASFGSEWPIGMMVDTLNRSHPSPPWNDDRVDNAKKRLRNWIGRLKRNHELDEIDLMGLFAGLARRQSADRGAPQPLIGQRSRVGDRARREVDHG